MLFSDGLLEFLFPDPGVSQPVLSLPDLDFPGASVRISVPAIELSQLGIGLPDLEIPAFDLKLADFDLNTSQILQADPTEVLKSLEIQLVDADINVNLEVDQSATATLSSNQIRYIFNQEVIATIDGIEQRGTEFIVDEMHSFEVATDSVRAGTLAFDTEILLGATVTGNSEVSFTSASNIIEGPSCSVESSLLGNVRRSSGQFQTVGGEPRSLYQATRELSASGVFNGLSNSWIGDELSANIFSDSNCQSGLCASFGSGSSSLGFNAGSLTPEEQQNLEIYKLNNSDQWVRLNGFVDFQNQKINVTTNSMANSLYILGYGNRVATVDAPETILIFLSGLLVLGYRSTQRARR